jgi:hypothetical protein
VGQQTERGPDFALQIGVQAADRQPDIFRSTEAA